MNVKIPKFQYLPARGFVPYRGGGFVLVITLTLMVLITLVAVAMLGLAAITLRQSARAQAGAAAQANAKLAMMMALGELQASLGPDRGVCAAAAAVLDTPRQAHLTGAWESWRWDPNESSSPDYALKAERFHGWLVSTAEPGDAQVLQLPAMEPVAASVELVGTLSHHSVPNSVRAALIPLAETSHPGAMAWAVFDESAKASIDLAEPLSEASGGTEVATRNAPERFRADIIDAKLASLKSPHNLVSLETAVIPGGHESAPEFRKRFHDFTTGSLGLLTDTANGGLKTDLTPLLEASSFSAAAFPAETLYATAAAGAPRWNYLYDHYGKYKLLTSATTCTPVYTVPAADLAVSPTGLDVSPRKERLLPVIVKLQIVFAIVSHHAHIQDRMNFMENQGVPPGNDKHAVPHLVYEPIITLFNPYDVALHLNRLRIRVWDPPVGFRFAKISAEKGTGWYRPEMANGEFHGLARMNYSNQRNTAARRTFTLYLTDGTGDAPGSTLRLQPGEVKVFSSRVEAAWSWGFEIANAYSPRSFFDWNPGSDFGNKDRRTSNQLGVEAVPGWDLRAGIQTDHMSYGGGGRPDASIYDFERNPGGPTGGFVSIRISDEILTELKPQRNTGADTTVPDFQVDVLAGNTVDFAQDLLRSYRFRLADPVAELSENPSQPVISRTFKVEHTLQKNHEQSIAGKKPLAILEMTARTTKDPLDDSKAWLYNNPVVEGAEQNSKAIGAANQSYDLRLIELTGWSSFPKIDLDATPGPGYGRGYFGASRNAMLGVTNVPMVRVAMAPACSLGDLIASNLVAGSLPPRVVHPFGNSRAHPLLPAAQVSCPLDGKTALDHSYWLNDTLWDRYFLSSACAYQGGVLGASRSRRQVLEGMLSGDQPALNARLAPARNHLGDAREVAARLDGLSDEARARELAGFLAVRGPFNLNSTSVDAWRAVLSALRDRNITAWNNRATPNAGATPLARMGLPLAGPADTSEDSNVLGQFRWAGYRNLDDPQILSLAEAIVEEISKRGIKDKAPPLSLAEFVNRRPGPSNELHSLAGILQTAIDNSGVNSANHQLDSQLIDAGTLAASRKTGALTPEAMTGFTGEGAPSMVTQGDLLAALAPIATVRGDTFKIRAYGEAGAHGQDVQARAWCEAVVQRIPEFLDPADAPETPVTRLTRQANRSFGRRFHIVAFRWLNPHEL